MPYSESMPPRLQQLPLWIPEMIVRRLTWNQINYNERYPLLFTDDSPLIGFKFESVLTWKQAIPLPVNESLDLLYLLVWENELNMKVDFLLRVTFTLMHKVWEPPCAISPTAVLLDKFHMYNLNFRKRGELQDFLWEHFFFNPLLARRYDHSDLENIFDTCVMSILKGRIVKFDQWGRLLLKRKN